MAAARFRRKIPLSLSLAALTAATLGSLASATVADAATHARHSGEYVALGDSYAAGPFLPIQRHDPIGCARSDHNYPSLLAADLGSSAFTDVSCSGATTENMTQSQAVPLGTNAPQFNALSEHTKLVTITISGNDIGFSDIALTCARLGIQNPFGNPCERFEGDSVSQKIDATAPKVAAVLRGIRERAPEAKIALVSYLRILPHETGCFPRNPFARGDVPYLDDVQRELDDMLATEAKHGHAAFVDAYAKSKGHDSCQPIGVKWVEPFTPTGPSAPLHPNEDGMRAVADMVEHALGVSAHAQD